MLKYWIFLYMFVINCIAFYLYAYDKKCALNNDRRVQNALLLTLAGIGGAYGAAMGMWLFRHKTKSTPYLIIVPIALVVWLAVWGLMCIFS